MIAFAGPSGGGKTTIFGLLERYYEPTAGEIRIGDTPIDTYLLIHGVVKLVMFHRKVR